MESSDPKQTSRNALAPTENINLNSNRHRSRGRSGSGSGSRSRSGSSSSSSSSVSSSSDRSPTRARQRSNGSYRPQRKSRQLFPEKLWLMINDNRFESAIRWVGDGNSFVICERQLESICLGKENELFYTKQPRSFVRQLHLYGFKKINKNQFKHRHFRRGRAELVRKIKRSYSPSQSNKLAVCADNGHSPGHILTTRRGALSANSNRQHQGSSSDFNGDTSRTPEVAADNRLGDRAVAQDLQSIYVQHSHQLHAAYLSCNNQTRRLLNANSDERQLHGSNSPAEDYTTSHVDVEGYSSNSDSGLMPLTAVSPNLLDSMSTPTTATTTSTTALAVANNASVTGINSAHQNLINCYEEHNYPTAEQSNYYNEDGLSLYFNSVYTDIGADYIL